MRMVQHWKLSLEDAGPPSLEIIKVQLDKALSNLIFEIGPCFDQEYVCVIGSAQYAPRILLALRK